MKKETTKVRRERLSVAKAALQNEKGMSVELSHTNPPKFRGISDL